MATLTGSQGRPFSATAVASASFALTGVTGAVARSAEDRLQDKLSALEWMTSAQRTDVRAATGSVDVTAALQAAIDYCQPRGIPIHCPAGVYLTTAPLISHSSGYAPGLRVVGDGSLGTIFRPNFTNGAVFDIDGAGTLYQVQRNCYFKDFSIYPTAEKSGLVGMSFVGILGGECSGLHIENMGSHAIDFPWRGDKTTDTNPDGWLAGFFDFDRCRIIRNGGWAVHQDSGIGGAFHKHEHGYYTINRQGGILISGPNHRVIYTTVSTNGQDNPVDGCGILVARRMGGSVANPLIENCELDSNYVANIWVKSSVGYRLTSNRHNSWETVFADGHLRPTVHVRLGGSNASSVAVRGIMLNNNHRAQNVAAGAGAERQLTWYHLNDSATSQTASIHNPYLDSMTSNAVRFGRSSGALATAGISGGAVNAITVVAGGLNYVVVPTVSFSGGGGTGAAATALTDGRIVEVAIVDPGKGFGSVPTVGFTGGGGTGAAATAVLDAYNQVIRIDITNPGTGYTSSPTVSITGGSPTRAASAQAVFTNVVSGFTITNGGSGYSSAPNVIIVPQSITAINADGFDTEIIENNDLVQAAPIVPCCRVRDSAGTIAVAGTGTTATTIAYATAISDPQSGWVAASGYTISSPGLYHVSASIGIPGLTAGKLVEIGIYETGTLRDIRRYKAAGITTAIGGGAGGESFAISGSYRFIAGSLITIRALTDEGSTKTLSTNSSDNSLLIYAIR